MYGPKGGLEAAVAAATKLDASLHAKGKLTKNLSEGLSKSDVLKLIQAEFSINHVPQATRNLLCKGSTQEIIKDFSGACVSTKGRYIPESERKNLNAQDKSAKNLGLYLFIQGPTNRSVDLAIQKIEEMIATNADMNNQRQPGVLTTATPIAGPLHGSLNTVARTPLGGNVPSALMSRNMQMPPPILEQTAGKFVEKIRIDMESVLPGFNLPMKLIGQGGSNLNYIKNETGAIVTLRGIGSAFLEPGTQQESPEPLHFCISHHKPEVMATARDLALNLIATIQQEYAQFQMQQPPPQNFPAQVQQISVEPPSNIMLHQAGNGEHPVIPNIMSTSIALPVVQTGFIQQPGVTQLSAPPPIVGVPPPQFSQPPPPQVALPPPGVHIPQQSPLVPPPVPQPLQQIQPQHEQPGNFIQQLAQPFQAGQQTSQQQYVITQNGQPMQGIMTSQGLVVLNQQTQPTYAQQHQVFLSQPPPVGPTQSVFQSGQHLAFQSTAPGQQLHAAVSVPVSYQFQYVQQNPPPTMAYSAVQNPIQVQPSHIQIQPQQQSVPQPQLAPIQSSSVSTGQSPVQNQPVPQLNPNVSQPSSLGNQSPTIQNPPSQRHSPNIQAPPPNQPNPAFSVQQNQSQMILQQIPNHQMIQNNQTMQLQNQNIQTIPATTANFLSGQPHLMQIPGVRPPAEVQQQFQVQQQNYSQYPQQQQQMVVKQIQVCQPQQMQLVPGCPPGPIQILPSPSGQFIAPIHQLPPTQYNQSQETQQEPKPPKRKFTEEVVPASQQGQTPPQSLMSIPMQPPQPVPPPTQSVGNNNATRQGIGVQELMLMNQQQRRQHLQQPEGHQKDPSIKVEEASLVPPPPPSTGSQPNFQMPESGGPDGDKGNLSRQWYDENLLNREMSNRHDSDRDRDDRNCYNRRDRNNRERLTFSHYSSKPQMYDTVAQHSILGIGMCPPPPPPPPPHLINQAQSVGQQQQQQVQQQSQQQSQQQQPPNHYYQTNRTY
ncbi:hypothetical protein RUM43_000184 [Polyplax serrata]|uniref:KH homology domain-containing protein 4 n=1 Tax=Polyplax serrata TaxID=468196 RepID=A0AAN8SD08_POLSC